MKKMICVSCDKEHNHKLDSDFCKKCYDETEKLMERDTIMDRAAAARAYLSGTPGSLHYRQMEVYAFLDISQPRMPEARKLEIIKAVI